MNQSVVNNHKKSELLGNSVPISELRSIIKQVAPTDVTVLITGESGTGKEVAAKEIHRLSKRYNKPFVTVNCGAIPEGIIESELFGHLKGSFTNAYDTRKGYFEMADKGTIFLDEIGELPLQTQVKFLRVIESGEYMKVGGSRTEHTDVRIIAATNKNLENLIRSGTFREDLYYRLRSVNIYIPPLRERKEDIEILFRHFVDEFCSRNGINFSGITDDAMNFIINYSWPGNVRQLKNFTESIITLNTGRIITVEEVKKHLNLNTESVLPALVSDYNPKNELHLIFGALFELKKDILDIRHKLDELEFRDSLHGGLFISDDDIENSDFEKIEKEVLKYYYDKYNGNISKISDKLKISSRTLYRKFKQYGLKNGRA
ncbi:MAG: sigma-54 dependent transcriptional regulator [Ignavibacteria bacterium]|nr:sigma-54 dependent transcriptional regulator [Ignavibacteria bacterium]